MSLGDGIASALFFLAYHLDWSYTLEYTWTEPKYGLQRPARLSLDGGLAMTNGVCNDNGSVRGSSRPAGEGGWKLHAEGAGSWRVFRKRVPKNEVEPLPFVIQVENKRVSIEYVEKAKKLIGEA